MKKEAFVTKEQIEEIVKRIRHHFIFMMKKESARMHRH